MPCAEMNLPEGIECWSVYKDLLAVTYFLLGRQTPNDATWQQIAVVLKP